MKNLATCKPSEFLKQTNRIRKKVEEWITVTDIIKIRGVVPEQIPLKREMTREERDEAIAENKRRMEEQGRKNMSRMLDSIMGDHPAETLEILALCCFVEPEDVDNHTITEYIESFNELIGNKVVLSFFTSLVQLGQTFTSS